MDSLGVTIHKLSNMIAYAFLIPLIPDLYELSTSDLTDADLGVMTKRILSFGGITLSGIVVKELIKKIIKRFKS